MRSMHPFSLRGLMAICAAVASLAGAPAHAGLISVDFKSGTSSPTYSGAAVTGAAGDIWNGVNGGDLGAPTDSSNVALVDATGANTGVTLSFGGTSGEDPARAAREIVDSLETRAA